MSTAEPLKCVSPVGQSASVADSSLTPVAAPLPLRAKNQQVFNLPTTPASATTNSEKMETTQLGNANSTGSASVGGTPAKGKVPLKSPEEFYKDLQQFHERRNTPLASMPKISGRDIDLYRLYIEVTDRGGFQKVNNRDEWDEIIPAIGLRDRCLNASAAIKLIYRRCLDKYERLNFFGEDPDKMEALEATIEQIEGGRSRSRYQNNLHTPSAFNVVPMTYNYRQHVVNMDRRRMLKMCTDLYKTSPYEKLCLSLISPLPNEQDFALNICAMLANENVHTLKLNEHPKLLDILLAHAGVFADYSLRILFQRVYTAVRRHSLFGFWHDLLYEKPHLLDFYTDEDTVRTAALLNENKNQMDADKRALLKEGLELDFFNLGAGEGTQEYIGQRVQQVAAILRSLSFFDENIQVYAKSRTFMRFFVMGANIRWGNIHNQVLDIAGNVATELILLDPTTDSLSRSLMATLRDGIEGSDRGVIINSLEILYKLCQREGNEDHVQKCLDVKFYEKICLFLSLNDIMLLIFTLEAIYALTLMGPRTCQQIMQVHGVIDQLMSLITVEAQSYGPDGCILMRVVETVPGNMLPMVAQNIANLQNVTTVVQKQQQQQQTTHSIQIIPQQIDADAETAAPQQQSQQIVNQQPTAPAAAPVMNNNFSHEDEQYALAWLGATFEHAGTTESHVEQQELYRMYLMHCQKACKHSVVNHLQFPRLVRLMFNNTVGPMAVRHSDGTERPGFHYVSIRVRAQPLPIQMKSSQSSQKAGEAKGGKSEITPGRKPKRKRPTKESQQQQQQQQLQEVKQEKLIADDTKPNVSSDNQETVDEKSIKLEVSDEQNIKKEPTADVGGLLPKVEDSAEAMQQTIEDIIPASLIQQHPTVLTTPTTNAATDASIGNTAGNKLGHQKVTQQNQQTQGQGPPSSSLIKSMLASKVAQRQQKQKDLTAATVVLTTTSTNVVATTSGTQQQLQQQQQHQQLQHVQQQQQQLQHQQNLQPQQQQFQQTQPILQQPQLLTQQHHQQQQQIQIQPQTAPIKVSSNAITALVNNPLMQSTPVKVGQTTIKPFNPQASLIEKKHNPEPMQQSSAPPPLAPLSGNNVAKDANGRPIILANQMLVEILDKKGVDPPTLSTTIIKRKVEETLESSKRLAMDTSEEMQVTPSKNAANLYAEMAASILEDEDLDDIPPLPIAQTIAPPQPESMTQSIIIPAKIQEQLQQQPSVVQNVQRQLLFQANQSPQLKLTQTPQMQPMQQIQQMQQMPTAMATIKTESGLQTVPVILQQKSMENQNQPQIIQQMIQQSAPQQPQQPTQYVLATNQQGQTYLVAQQQPQQQPPPTQTVLLTQSQHQSGPKTIIILQQQSMPQQQQQHQQHLITTSTPQGTQKMIMTTPQGQQVLVTQRTQSGLTHGQTQPQYIINPQTGAATQIHVPVSTAGGTNLIQRQIIQSPSQQQATGTISPSLLSQLNHIPATIKLHQPQLQMQSTPQQTQPATISRLGKSVSIVQTTPALPPPPPIQIPQLQQHQSIIQQHIISGPSEKRQVILGGRAIEIKETVITQTQPPPQQSQLNSQTIITTQPTLQNQQQQQQIRTVIDQQQQQQSTLLQQKMSFLPQKSTTPAEPVLQAIVPAQPTLTAIKKPMVAHIKSQQQQQQTSGMVALVKPNPTGPPPLAVASSNIITQQQQTRDERTTPTPPRVQTPTVTTLGPTLQATPPPLQMQMSMTMPTLPTPSLPTVSLPTPSLPTVHLPTPSLPTVALPSLSLPSSSLPTPSLPTVCLPMATLPTPSLPMPSLPTPSLPTPSLPTTFSPTPTPAVTALAPQSPTPQTVIDANWLYICDWRYCPRRKFKSLNDLQHHVCTAHCPDHLDPSAEIFCQWGPGPNLCDGIPRKRYSMMTHLIDRHLTSEGLRLAMQRRIATGTYNVQHMQAPVTIVRNVDRANTASPALSTSSSSSLPMEGNGCGSSALQAIKRHTADYTNAKELMDENEGPVTKSIRLSAALILRNLVTYTSSAKNSLRRYEPQLANAALSNVESSGAISHILFELNSEY